jgi:predicted enzyme related to lactoylglutathione lyase
MPDYAPGTPSWVELSSPDADASAAFYRDLMGWSTTEPGPTEETGGSRMFQQDGQNVGGLMGHMQEGQPTAWATYVTAAASAPATTRAPGRPAAAGADAGARS